MEGRIEELLGSFRVEAADEFRRVFEIGKEHGDLLAFAFQGRAGGQNLVGEMGRGVGQRGCVRRACLYQCHIGSGWRRSRGTADPDQHGVVLVHRDLVHLDEFEL